MSMKRISVFLISVLLLSTAFLRPVYGDVGPKPSVSIEVTGAPDKPYFLTLLSDRENYGPWSKVSDEGSGGEDLKDRAFSFFASYKDAEGYCFLGNMSEELRGESSFSWTYYPPDRFKIALYCPEDGTFYLSGICKREAFYSYFVLDLKDGTPQVKEVSRLGRTMLYGLFRALATVLVELALAYLFAYRDRKALLSVLFVNLFTQVVLNLFLAWSDHYGGMLVWMLFFLIGELGVIVLEMILYLFLLRKEKKLKLLFYTFLANLLSAILTFVTVFLTWV